MGNFFDNIKDIKNNPFAKKKVVANNEDKKEVTAPAPDPVTEETTAEKLARIKKNGTAQDRINSIVAAVAKATEDKEKAKTDNVFAKKKEETPTEVTVDTDEVKDEPEDVKVQEEVNEVEVTIEQAIEEEVVEEKPKKKTTRKTKKTAVVGSGTEATTNKFELNYDIMGEKMSYDDIVSYVRDYYLENDWQSIEDEINTRVSEMVIAPDMNSATLLELLANIDMLNSDIQMQIRRDRQFMDSVTNKEFGVAIGIKLQNSYGTNIQERNRSGLMALTQVPVGNKKVNYLYGIAVATMRLSFLENVSKQLDYKRQMCITVAANLKIENSLSAAHA